MLSRGNFPSVAWMQVKYDNSARYYFKHHPLRWLLFFGISLAAAGGRACRLRGCPRDSATDQRSREALQRGRDTAGEDLWILDCFCFTCTIRNKARAATRPGPILVSCFRIPVFLQAISWNEIWYPTTSHSKSDFFLRGSYTTGLGWNISETLGSYPDPGVPSKVAMEKSTIFGRFSHNIQEFHHW